MFSFITIQIAGLGKPQRLCPPHFYFFCFIYLKESTCETRKNVFFKLGFTPCKAEQPLRGMELQEKKAQKRLQDKEYLFRNNLQLKDVC